MDLVRDQEASKSRRARARKIRKDQEESLGIDQGLPGFDVENPENNWCESIYWEGRSTSKSLPNEVRVAAKFL